MLGSAHTGSPFGESIISTDLVVRPVTVGFGADIGVNACIQPDLHIAAHAIVGLTQSPSQDVPG